MRHRLLLTTALLLLTPGLLFAGKPLTGKVPPELTLSKVLQAEKFKADGKVVNLAGLRGHLILLEFWATW